MKDVLYVNGRTVDLAPGTVIATTVKAIEVAQLDVRDVTHTNQLKVPATPSNDITFGFARNEQSRTSKPYQLLPCKLVQGGIETIPVGTCIIKRFDDGYVLNVLEEMFDVFAALEGKSLKDIDPIPDSNWDELAMDTARTATDNLISAIVYWGKPIFDSDFFLPSFYYHTIIEAILQYTGVQLSGSILSDARFKDLVIPFPGDSFDIPPELTLPAPTFDSKGSVGTSEGSTDVTVTPPSVTSGNLLFLLAMCQSGAINTPAGWTLLAADTFNDNNPTLAGTGALFYKVSDGTETAFTLTKTDSTGSFACQVYQYVGSENITIENAAIKSDGNGSSTLTWNAVTVNGSKRTLAAFVAMQESSNPGTPTGYTESASDQVDSGGISISLELSTKADVNTDGQVTATGGSANGWITFHVSIYNNEDLSIDWNLYWPDIDAKDLLQDFFTRFGIIPKQRYGILYLKTIEAILSDRVNVMDWSAKLVKSKRPIDFSLDYAQNNNFDYVNILNDPTFGRGVMTIDNTVLPFEDELYASLFEQAEGYSANGYTVASIPVYNEDSEDITDFQDSPGIKLLTLKARTTEDPITFFATPRTDYKLGYFIDGSLAKDTGWQYFLDQFYPKLAEALQKNKVITKEYKLSAIDIKNYDSHKMMWDGDGYYLVNKIINFVNGKITKVELFKVA